MRAHSDLVRHQAPARTEGTHWMTCCPCMQAVAMSQCISQLGSQDSCGRMVHDALVGLATPGTLSCTCQPPCAQSPCK